MIRPNFVEPLESRLALSIAGPLPLDISDDGKSATFVDADGDVFTVTTSKGRFTTASFTYLGDTETGRGYLQKIDVGFSSSGRMFQGAKLTVTVDQVVGDGFADVGYINAAGVDLKQAVVDGDLVRIDVGDFNQRTPAVGLLQAAQLGFHTAEEAGVPDFFSHVIGRINVLDIGSWRDASMYVVGLEEKTEKFGSIGRVFIQSMTGGSTVSSAVLFTDGSIGTIVVQGDLTGGSGAESGSIECGGRIGSLTIGGNLVGGDSGSGRVFAAGVGGKSIGTAVVGGSIVGGTGDFSGSIYTFGSINSLEVHGDVKAGTSFMSGSVTSINGSAKSITIAGDLIGGPAVSGIFVRKTLGKLTLGGSDGTAGPAYIIAVGPLAGGVAIEKITVSESLNGTRILAGYDFGMGGELELTNPNVRIGNITVGGNLIATDIVAGIDGVNGVFGDSDDKVAADDPKPKYLSSIASIIVGAGELGGIIEGTEGGTDQFGILAERIGFVKVGDTVLPLGKKTIDDLALGTKGDYVLREIQSLA